MHESLPDYAPEHSVLGKHLVLVQSHDLLFHADDPVIQGDQFLTLVRADLPEFLHRVHQVDAAAHNVDDLRRGVFQHLLPVAVLVHAAHEDAVHLAGGNGDLHLSGFLVVGREVFDVAQPLVLGFKNVDARLQRVGTAASAAPEVLDDQGKLFILGVSHDDQHVLSFFKENARGVFKFAVLAGAQAVRQVLHRFVRFRQHGAGLAVVLLVRHLLGDPAHEGVADFRNPVTVHGGLQRHHEFIREDIGIQRLQTFFRNGGLLNLLGREHAAPQPSADGQQKTPFFEKL